MKKVLLKILNKYISKWIVLCVDLLLIVISLFCAYYIRYNVGINFNFEHFFRQLPIITLFAFISFLIVGSYKGIIRHTGIKDAFNVFIGVSLHVFLIISFYIFIRFTRIYEEFKISKSIILIHYLINICFLIFSRFIFRTFFELISTKVKSIINVLIYGAGNSGMITYGALNREQGNNYAVFGFIDDHPNKINKRIDRIKIYDPSKIDQNFILKNNIKEIIISIQNIESNRLLEITDQFLSLDVRIKIVPPLKKWIDGDLQINEIKQINIDDLLGRKQISIDNPIVKRDVKDKVVFVTGAAGSIGSEISRQLCSYDLELLVLIDQSESPLYDLQQELLQKNDTNFKAIVADVRNAKRMRMLFEEFSPQKVFHAAAYKHVPLMEYTPYEAIKTNILGTKNIADLSVEFGVERFVMVSTDKAVNPTNVMGATKRVAEMYISCLSEQKNNTKFTTTRFGNVLGSNGSVIPLFKKQLKKGGPLTVTHKDITRYFMTIPEACRLVLEAGTMGLGGEIYIFDMGKSVKIFDMAKRMISLSGLKYPKDIDIKIVGLRPGEKLYEELLASEEDTIKTYHKKIMIAKTKKIDIDFVLKKINELSVNSNLLNNEEVVSIVKQIVPEYISNNSVYEKLDLL